MVERIEHIDFLNECRNIKSPKELENYSAQFHPRSGIFASKKTEQRELIFHNSVPLEESALPLAREKAAKQKEIVLDFFRQRFSMNFTPYEAWVSLMDKGNQMLFTSARRSISDLTKEGRLIKCQWSERREGAYGKPNRTWRYNASFINRLNPQR